MRAVVELAVVVLAAVIVPSACGPTGVFPAGSNWPCPVCTTGLSSADGPDVPGDIAGAPGFAVDATSGVFACGTAPVTGGIWPLNLEDAGAAADVVESCDPVCVGVCPETRPTDASPDTGTEREASACAATWVPAADAGTDGTMGGAPGEPDAAGAVATGTADVRAGAACGPVEGVDWADGAGGAPLPWPAFGLMAGFAGCALGTGAAWRTGDAGLCSTASAVDGGTKVARCNGDPPGCVPAA